MESEKIELSEFDFGFSPEVMKRLVAAADIWATAAIRVACMNSGKVDSDTNECV